MWGAVLLLSACATPGGVTPEDTARAPGGAGPEDEVRSPAETAPEDTVRAPAEADEPEDPAGSEAAPADRRAFDLDAIRAALVEAGVDTWLLCDFRGSDPAARRILGLPGDRIHTRRWCYAIPADGAPLALVHAIEPDALDGLPGERIVYRTWQDHADGVRRLATLGGADGSVALAYSPDHHNPYVDTMPGGLVEWVRATGVSLVPSADLVQEFEATLTPAELESHRRAASIILPLVDDAFAHAAERACAGTPLSERDLQMWIADGMTAAGLVFGHPPIVAVGPNAASPHYVPAATGSARLETGSLVLIDAWAKEPGGIYADMTRMAMLGVTVPEVHANRFALILEAQQAALDYIRGELAKGQAPRAYLADREARGVIEAAGYGERFLHRTGHSIGTSVHGNGAHLDDLETRDARALIESTCFSIEPGIYIPGEAGYRSEIDVCIVAGDGGRLEAQVTTTPRQRAIAAVGCGGALDG